MMEQAVVFGKTHPLIGIITDPTREAQNGQLPAVVILNAGIMHRVGPGRIYVTLARRLADAGYVVARFDHSGIGDSDPRRDNLPFDQSSVKEAQEVMDYLAEHRGIKRFVLAGLCSGAVTAFRTARSDERVAGAVLMNAQGFDSNLQWIYSVLNQGWARHYKRSLLSLDSWWRAVSGRIQYRRLVAVLWRKVKSCFFRPKAVSAVVARLATEFRGLVDRGVCLLLVFSKGDYSCDFIRTILGKEQKRMMRTGRLRSETIPETDHTFTLRKNQQRLMDVIEEWLTTQEGL